MPPPLPSLTFPSSASSHKRKRSRSSTLVLSISPPYDIKRARTGIQELTTDDTPAPHSLINPLSSPETTDSSALPSLVNSLTSATTADSPESLESPSDTSSDDVSEATSSDSNSESGEEYFEVDEGYDSDSESTSSSSSSSSSSEENDGYAEAELQPQPRSRSLTLSSPTPAPLPHSSLSSRLGAFLPTLAAANARLELERRKGTLGERNIENVTGDGRYIEMDLGLGVLEEKRDGEEDMDESSQSGDGGDEGNDAEDESEVTDGSGLPRKEKKKRAGGKKRCVMSRLMGRKEGQEKRAGIEEVEDG